MRSTGLFMTAVLWLIACTSSTQSMSKGNIQSVDVANEDAAAMCFCCSGSRGTVDASDVGDVNDCSWCPIKYGTCGSSPGSPPGGGLHEPSPPAYTCAIGVPNGAHVDNSTSCPRITLD